MSGGSRVRDRSRGRGHVRADGRHRATKRSRASGARTAAITRSQDRGEETAGGAIEHEPCVLPGRALTESCQSLHVAQIERGFDSYCSANP
jgi:hypothetical protein